MRNLDAGTQSLERQGGDGLTVLYFSSGAHVQGGAAQSMFRSARWLRRGGGEPVVVLPREGSIVDWYEREAIEVVLIPFVEMHRRKSPFYIARYVFSTLCLIARLLALIRRRHIDIVHVNEIIYWPGLVAGRVGGRNTICHVRTIITEPRWVRHLLTRSVYGLADRILCVSDAVRDEMFDWAGDKVKRLYNPGPDIDRFDPCVVQGRDEIRAELGIDPGVFVVGQVSKFTPNKNQMALIRAAEHIEKTHRAVGLRYLLVGGEVPNYEEYFREVLHRIAECGMESRFFLTGMREDVPRMIAACDAMVHLPAHEDPFPGVVLEAMAMEKPIVASKSGGIPEQFEDGQSGVLVPKHDVDALARAILSLVEDRDRRLEIGKEARRHLMAHFSRDKYCSALMEVYASVAALSPTGPMDSGC